MTCTFNPNNYSHLYDDSAMIQSAVDEAKNTGETVVIPRLNKRTGECVWNITRAIKLYSGSVICLDNCILRQADGVFDNIFVNSNLGTPEGFTREGRQKDIKIYGLGNATLDGGIPNGITEHTQGKDDRPVIYNSMINFLNVERFLIENIRIKNQRYWSMAFHYCSHGKIKDIDFYATGTTTEQDGIDLRTGCNHFTIDNITGCTEDDVVAMTCMGSLFDEAIKDAQLDDSIHHITVKNICAKTPSSLVRILNHHGKKIYNVLIENLMESSENDPAIEKFKNMPPLDEDTVYLRGGASVRIGENFYYRDGKKALPEDTYNITVRNLKGRMRMGIKVSCALSNALFDNIHVYGDGGTGVYFGEGDVNNVTVRDIIYSPNHAPKESDDNRNEIHWNQQKWDLPPIPDRKVCAVYFKETNAKNIIFDHIHASKSLTSVFGGNGNVSMKATNIITENSDTPIFDPELTVSKMKEFEF